MLVEIPALSEICSYTNPALHYENTWGEFGINPMIEQTAVHPPMPYSAKAML